MADAALLPPPAPLAGCVRAFYWRDVGDADLVNGSGQTHIPPGPYAAVVWMVSGRAQLFERAGRAVDEELPSCLLAGPHRHPYRSRALTPYSSFGLVLQPAALPLLGGPLMQGLAECIQPAEPALGADWQPLLQAVARAPDHLQRMALCQHWLQPRWDACATQRGTWERLAAAAWQRPLQHLACSAFNWTQRHFQRRSKAVTGLRAGEVERQLRLERALVALRNGEGNAAQVAAAHGYADQAHFTREARAVYGAPPAELVRRLREERTDGDWLLRL